MILQVLPYPRSVFAVIGLAKVLPTLVTKSHDPPSTALPAARKLSTHRGTIATTSEKSTEAKQQTAQEASSIGAYIIANIIL